MLFAAYRFRRAAQEYGRRLPSVLRRSYGGGDRYTLAQIQRAVAMAKLDARFIALAYGAYLSEAEFVAVDPVMPGGWDYRKAGDCFLQAVPVGVASSENPPLETGVANWGDGVSGGP